MLKLEQEEEQQQQQNANSPREVSSMQHSNRRGESMHWQTNPDRFAQRDPRLRPSGLGVRRHERGHERCLFCHARQPGRRQQQQQQVDFVLLGAAVGQEVLQRVHNSRTQYSIRSHTRRCGHDQRHRGVHIHSATAEKERVQEAATN